ncbi:helix-turn-helix domain-containing protein [Dyadobacter sp. CY345]|uniref:helix-turn-helix domain-containing protein n=1 Tax=Dyadobacter sp. CY345 TaxID=2909335 RepID=UPI001F294BA1|nr:helix-turn-helix domain-containing protein [Dyadobacter sp. CY345]MCF2444070.1 helix-turn-helix domain-containing protein [Dyadobacter sp. CY345]
MEALRTSELDSLIEKEIKDSFSINRWENYLVSQPEVLRATYNRILLISDGYGTLFIDDKAFSISGNEIFLLGKGQVFSFGKFSNLNGYELSFGDCFWEKTPASSNNCKAVLFNNITGNQHLPVRTELFQEFSFLFQTLFLEYSGRDYLNKPDALAAYLKIIMIKTGNLNRSLSEAFNSFDNQLYNSFLDLVNQQFRQVHDVFDYAKQLSISPRKLSEVCKQRGGKGPKDIINNKLIAEAKRALQFSSKPVKEIAFELDFSTAEQFSHFFKKYTKLSPQLYRAGFVKIGM